MEANTTNARVEQFRAEVAELDIKTPGDSGERTWLIIGIVLLVVGGLLIFAGYYGASGTKVVGDQIPYLISGGFLGLGLMVAGAAMFVRFSLTRYLRFWLVRSIYEDRAQADTVADALGRIEVLLRESSRTRADVDQ